MTLLYWGKPISYYIYPLTSSKLLDSNLVNNMLCHVTLHNIRCDLGRVQSWLGRDLFLRSGVVHDRKFIPKP